MNAANVGTEVLARQQGAVRLSLTRRRPVYLRGIRGLSHQDQIGPTLKGLWFRAHQWYIETAAKRKAHQEIEKEEEEEKKRPKQKGGDEA
jgi:hypothetical protein